jgi:hypothetical protein
MKQLLLTVIIALICLNSNAFNYPKPFKKSLDPIVMSVNLPKEDVWKRLVGLFVSNSIPIKLMDKSTGLIQSEKIGLGSHYALTNADDSTSWALCEVLTSPEGIGFYWYPQIINGELQIYVQETADGKTLLSINLMNLAAYNPNLIMGNDRTWMIESTKRLENNIANYLSTYAKMPAFAFDPPLATFGEPPSQIAKREAAAQQYQEMLRFNEQRRIENEEQEAKEAWKKPFYWLAAIIVVAAYTAFKLLTDPNR